MFAKPWCVTNEKDQYDAHEDDGQIVLLDNEDIKALI